MPHTVGEIMNGELFYLRSDDSIEEARAGLLGLSIAGAPVLDRERRPVGSFSLRDLCDPVKRGYRVGDRMSSAGPAVRASEGVEAAARVLARTSSRRLLVVDAEGRALGVASAVDFVRALVDLAPAHPSAFPHLTG